MIKQLLPLIISILLFSFCGERKDSSHIAILIRGMEETNKVLRETNRHLYFDFEEKLSHQVYAYKAEIWEPQVNKAKEISAEILSYVHAYK